MIQGYGVHQAKVMLLKIEHTGTNKVEYKTIKGETFEERESLGWQEIYLLNKNRVSVTLCSWLKQRMFGLKEYSPVRSQEASRLLVLMNYHHQFHYFKMCKLVADNRAAIESIAPKPSSQQYNYYKNTILEILAECELMKGQSV